MNELTDQPSPPVQDAGYFIPWYPDTDQPALIVIEGVHFLPVFSAVEKLRASEKVARYPAPVTVKRVDDTREFLASVLGQVRVALDPRPTERGTTRFTELKLAD